MPHAQAQGELRHGQMAYFPHLPLETIAEALVEVAKFPCCLPSVPEEDHFLGIQLQALSRLNVVPRETWGSCIRLEDGQHGDDAAGGSTGGVGEALCERPPRKGLQQAKQSCPSGLEGTRGPRERRL